MATITDNTTRYAEKHSTPAGTLLNEVERGTYAREFLPHMMSGRTTGRLLGFLSHIIKPKRVLEVGTFTGYGTLCLTEGLAEGGIIHTIEVNPETASRAQHHFESSGKQAFIYLHIGDAKDIIPTIDEQFDMVFIDADKKHYETYYTLILPKLAPGGIMVADNVLWYGKVVSGTDDKDAQALNTFNERVTQDARTQNILLTVDDGLMLIRKKI